VRSMPHCCTTLPEWRPLSIEEIWLESSETKQVAALMRGDASLWLTARTVPIGRLSHEARTLRPVIENLIEV